MPYIINSSIKENWINLTYDINPLIFQFIEEINKIIDSIVVNFIKPLISDILNNCKTNLEPFYGIPAKYKMNNKELPTTHSNFTGNIFTPLINFTQ